MTIKQNAPEGATHYDNFGQLIRYFNRDGLVWNGFNYVIDTCWFRNLKPL